MKARIQKLKILKSMIFCGVLVAYRTWKTEVWPNDLDDYDCCSGRECLCGGYTIKECYGIEKTILD